MPRLKPFVYPKKVFQPVIGRCSVYQMAQHVVDGTPQFQPPQIDGRKLLTIARKLLVLREQIQQIAHDSQQLTRTNETLRGVRIELNAARDQLYELSRTNRTLRTRVTELERQLEATAKR